MLLQFSVENYGSIWERQTLNMMASAGKNKSLACNVIHDDSHPSKPQLLRTAAIYGPNGAGKTTIIRALSDMKNLVINSAKESQADEPISVTPFLLSQAGREGDCVFEVIFMESGVRYQYGFRVNAERFTEEWLTVNPKRQNQKWFHRVFNAQEKKDEYQFSDTFNAKKHQETWRDATRPNALFLSTALQFNSAQLTPVLFWFKDRLKTIGHQDINQVFTIKQFEKNEERERIINLMRKLDLGGLVDIQIKKLPFDFSTLPKDIPKVLKEELIKDLNDQLVTDVKYIHQDAITGESIEIDEKKMSAGTQSLFAFSGPWLDILANDKVLIVDELDSSLHPLITHQLVKMINGSQGRAQLIFTTHDTSVMSQKMLRRDQLWFVEKNQQNATELYSLAEINGVREDEAIEKRYLNGRYGGIPFLQALDFHG